MPDLSSLPSIVVIAEVFQYASTVVALLIVPYSLLALFWKRNHPHIRYACQEATAYYHPSLTYLRWLNWAFILAILYLVSNFALRVYLHLEPAAPAAEQPPWSYALSMFGTCLLLLVFVLPSTFLLTLKAQIIEDPIIDVGDKLSRERDGASN